MPSSYHWPIRLIPFLIDNKRKVSFFSIGFIILLITLLFLIRPLLLDQVEKRIKQIAEQKNIEIGYEKIDINGLTTISLQQLYIVPLPNDTLLKAQDIKVSVDLFSLFLFKINISDLQISNISLRFIKKEGYCNYDFLFRTSQSQEEITPSQTNFAKQFNLFFDLLFRFLPQKMQINNIEIESYNHQFYTKAASGSLQIKDHTFAIPLLITEDGHSNQWNIEGKVNKSSRSISGYISSNGSEEQFSIPYLKSVYNIFIGMNRMNFALQVDQTSLSDVVFSGSIATEKLAVSYWRLASDTIYPGDLSFDFHCQANRECVEIDSTSLLTINQLKIHPAIKIAKKKDYLIKVSLDEKAISAQQVIASLPRGLFQNLCALQIEGTFDYRFLLDVDLSNPDSLFFDAGVSAHQLKIKDYGTLLRMNQPFLYTAYQNQMPVRSFVIGTENPCFRTLTQISPYLQAAVLQSEDGGFFVHKGFQMDALKEALIYDLKKRRFARGGSTISMQLVKNIFLSKEKSVFRKIEEAALVWLIENKEITSKARMFEVYMNIIEWGPMVYGAEEAARFYFDTSASDLSVEQSLFLAGLIPSPKRFASGFDSTGVVKEYTFHQMKVVAQRLSKLGVISDQEVESLSPLEITGPAKKHLLQAQKEPEPEDISEERLY